MGRCAGCGPLARATKVKPLRNLCEDRPLLAVRFVHAGCVLVGYSDVMMDDDVADGFGAGP